MKNKIILLAAAALAVCFPVRADFYASAAASGTTNAAVQFAADDGRQASLIVGVDATSDLAGSVLTFTRGLGSFAVATANTNPAATNIIVTGTGTSITNGDLVLVQKANYTVTNANVASVVVNTNGTLTVNFTGALGVAVTTSDALWQLGMTRTTPVGAATVRLYNECLFYAPAGAPLRLTVNGTSACSLNNVVVYHGTR